MVDVDISGLSTLFGFGITITAIATTIWRGVIWLNEQQDKKIKTRTEQEEKKARELREYTDKMAVELRTATAKVATDLQTYTAKVATDLQRYTEKTAIDLKELTEQLAIDLKANNEKINKDIIAQMQEMDQKLTTRANLTNGNVSNIRKDLLELSEDIEKLYDITDRSREPLPPIPEAMSRRQTENARKRRRRLEQINSDRDSQNHPDTSDRGDME